MRSALGGLAAALLLLVAAQPATASTTPAQVGLVSFTRASLSGDSATLTLDWGDTARARSYQIFMSRSYSMSSPRVLSSTSSTRTVTGLVRGVSYFFQVRAVNGGAVGSKSSRVGHTTIRSQGAGGGSTYRVMTYNLCSEKCSGWATTRKAPALARIAAFKPDVVALQEAGRLALSPPTGYGQAAYKSAKMLWFNGNRFKVAMTTCPAGDASCMPALRSGWIALGGTRYAVWAELVDLDTEKSTIFVSVHTTPGKSDEAALLRRDETLVLVRALAKLNPEQRPVVYAGDFNSHKNRSNDYLAGVFHSRGYYDAFDLAMSLRRQHHNSYNDFSVRPVISDKWGDHVDHVWVRPGDGKVLSWQNGASIVDGRMVTPIPSDHSPVVVDVRLN